MSGSVPECQFNHQSLYRSVFEVIDKIGFRTVNDLTCHPFKNIAFSPYHIRGITQCHLSAANRIRKVQPTQIIITRSRGRFVIKSKV